MNTLNKTFVQKVHRPIKVIQYGEGNFLRGFVDYMIDIANEVNEFNGNIVMIKPINHGKLNAFHEQDCIYTVSLRGFMDGKEAKSNRLVTSVTDVIDPYHNYDFYADLAKEESLRFVVSNTTEAGIVYMEEDSFDLCPPKSYPGKLTKFLYERFQHFQGDLSKGLIILPVELIDDNGTHLKEIVEGLSKEWNLGDDFITWTKEACIFCNTLVDRIVTGYPKEEEEKFWQAYGYRDSLIVTGEPFALWVIESEKDICKELPLDQAGLPVVFTDNQKPYKERKVRILNGAHTAFALASYLAGNDTVLESMEDEPIHGFLTRAIFDEIIPTLALAKEDLLSFAHSVLERFKNPYIKHSLLSISLNSLSKWRARCMPSFLEYQKTYGKLPPCLTFSLAALMEFYTGSQMIDRSLLGNRQGKEYQIKDDIEDLEFFAEYSQKEIESYVFHFLSNIRIWGQDLSQIPGLTNQLINHLTQIRQLGMREAIKDLLG